MAEVLIKDSELQALSGRVVLVTGSSSGIGLATVELLSSLGAVVIAGDIQDLPESVSGKHSQQSNLLFQKTDVTNWAQLSSLFKKAKASFGHIDHVFVNAGITSKANFLEDNVDENGDLLEPTLACLDVNLLGVVKTAALALFHMRPERQATKTGGSIVLCASATSFQRFRATDYTVAKHGVHGLMRGLIPNLKASNIPIRVNSTNPSWTASGIVQEKFFEGLDHKLQSPSHVARAVAMLMADESRNGQAIYTVNGKHFECEEHVLLKAAAAVVGEGNANEDTVWADVIAHLSA